MKSVRKMSFMKTFLLFAFVLAQFLTGAFSIVRGGRGRGVSSASFQIHHLIFMLMFFYMVCLHKDRRKSFGIIIPSFWLVHFVAYTVIGFLAFVPVFGIHIIFINFLYSIAVMILFFSVYRNEDPNAIIDVIGVAMICTLIIITIKLIVEVQVLISYFAGGGGTHPGVTSFTGGGVNLEASLLALYSVFVMKKKYALPVCFMTLLISALYSSRTAFILSALVLIWYLMFVKTRTGRSNLTLLLLITVPFVAIVVYFMMTSSIGQVLITRFLNTGDEGGSMARIKMWQYVADVIVRYPFGVGCGNALDAIELLSGDTFSEGGIHNIFFQITLEQGIFVGLPFLIVSALWILRREMRIRFQDPFGVFMLLYLVQGALQSRGYDAWMADILGLYFISRKRNWYAATR